MKSDVGRMSSLCGVPIGMPARRAPSCGVQMVKSLRTGRRCPASSTAAALRATSPPIEKATTSTSGSVSSVRPSAAATSRRSCCRAPSKVCSLKKLTSTMAGCDAAATVGRSTFRMAPLEIAGSPIPATTTSGRTSSAGDAPRRASSERASAWVVGNEGFGVRRGTLQAAGARNDASATTAAATVGPHRATDAPKPTAAPCSASRLTTSCRW